jgi:hypothetical protein
MRAGYFVSDLDNGQVSIGQARYSDESKIVVVQAGSHGLASAINQPQYAQTAQTYPPAPFATTFSQNASVSRANITIGVATISPATDSGSSEPSQSIFSASTSWSNIPTDSSNLLSTSLVATSTTLKTTSSVSSATSSTRSGNLQRRA